MSDNESVQLLVKYCGRTFNVIADALNAEGHTTRRGVPWNQVQVKRILDRANDDSN